MKSIINALMVMVFILFNSSLAQVESGNFALELNGGASLMTQKIDGAGTNAGFGFEGILHYGLTDYAGLYAGWGWNQFSADETFAGNDSNFEETGYLFGLQFSHPIAGSGISYFLRVGGLYNHIEVENSDGDIISDTGHGSGLQLAGGIIMPVGSDWYFTPSLKFNALTRNAQSPNGKIQLDYTYFALRVGFTKAF